MNKILLGVLVGAAVAGIAYYLYDPEGAKSQLNNLKNRANEASDEAEDYLRRKSKTTLSAMDA